MHRIVGRLSYANVMATVAVFLALGGVSYAALKLPRNSVGAKQLKKGAVTPAKLGVATRRSLAGATGPRGATGAQGPQGVPGPAGQAGGVLPSGVTLRGAVGVGAQFTGPPSKLLTTAVGFDGYRLPVRPVAHVVNGFVPQFPDTPACPGSVADPQAAPGQLCVYLAEVTPNNGVSLYLGDPAQKGEGAGVKYALNAGVVTETVAGDGRVSAVGFRLDEAVTATSEGQLYGTWAVTAP